MSVELPPDWPKHVAGPVGSIIGLYWLKGGGWTKFFGFFTGCAAAWLGAAYAAKLSGMDEGLAGGLLGMFGFSLISKAFDTLQKVDLKGLIERKLGGQ